MLARYNRPQAIVRTLTGMSLTCAVWLVAVAWAPIALADEIGNSWQTCETSAAYGTICATWTRNVDGTWSGKGANGAVMALSITANGTTVSISRSDPSGPSAGLTASYTGTLANDYGSANGQVTWTSQAGRATGTTGTWKATIYGATRPISSPTATPASPTSTPAPERRLTATLDCGTAISVQVGTPASPGQGTPCNLVIDGFDSNTTTPVEVIPMNTVGTPADPSALVPSTGIVAFPGQYAEDPTGMYRPSFDPFIFSACPQTSICGSNQSPTAPMGVRILVRQGAAMAVAAVTVTPVPSGATQTNTQDPVQLGAAGPIAASLDCGALIGVHTGTTDNPGPSSPCNLVFDGFISNTATHVDVIPTNANGVPADFSGLIPGTGIVVYPGAYSEDPSNLQRPRPEPFLFAACPQTNICGPDMTPTAPALIHVVVRQRGTGQGQADITIIPLSPTRSTTSEVTAGSSGGFQVGCIPCDGRLRFLGLIKNTIVLGPVPPSLDTSAEASVAQRTTGAGTLRNLKVYASASDGGIWNFTVWVNGAPAGLNCTIDPIRTPGQLSCDSGSASLRLQAGDRLSLAVGNPGNPFTQGQFYLTWSIEFGS